MTLRIEPTQARSSARLRSLLDATAQVVDEVGLERITTNLIAERAGSSIGTLYRYFPDRVAVLRGLALRHVSLIHADFQRELSLVAPDESGLQKALESMIEVMIGHYQNEPGWAAIAFDHTFDMPVRFDEQQLVTPPLRGERSPREQIAHDVAIRFADDNEQLSALTTDLQMFSMLVHALLDRAFAIDKAGDPAALKLARGGAEREVVALVERHRARRQRAA